MLLALLTGFALSQAFRTVTSTLAHGLQTEFGLSNADLAAFATTFIAEMQALDAARAETEAKARADKAPPPAAAH